jgi:F-type H+-transporting ATPase subunit a
MHGELHLGPETITHIFGFPLTNSFLLSITASILLIIFAVTAGKKLKEIPDGWMNMFESIIETGWNFTKELAHGKTFSFFPIFASFFLFILLSNWIGLIPGVGSIGFWEHETFVPIFRSAGSDLNITMGLALISVAAVHFYAVKYLGVGGYLKKWFSLNPILLFVGLLELVSEVTKMISLSFRLYGNVFAGEVVLSTITGIFAFFAPIPFYLLEVLVGVVQASVFAILTLVFMSILSSDEGHA